VADDDGEIGGLSQSFVREGYWVLSLLATAPTLQRRGIGRELLAAALQNAASDGPGSIQSSRHPSAMTLYSSAGLSLHPTVRARGRLDQGRVQRDDRVRHAGPDEFAVVDAIDRNVRGSARTVDVEFMMQDDPGCRLLLLEDRAYALSMDDQILTMGGRDEEAAAAVLRTALAEMADDKTTQVDWLTSHHQWALRVVIGAGMELAPYGPLMIRGMAAPPSPYIPNGAFG
jgi:hypothetical protein